MSATQRGRQSRKFPIAMRKIVQSFLRDVLAANANDDFEMVKSHYAESEGIDDDETPDWANCTIEAETNSKGQLVIYAEGCEFLVNLICTHDVLETANTPGMPINPEHAAQYIKTGKYNRLRLKQPGQ